MNNTNHRTTKLTAWLLAVLLVLTSIAGLAFAEAAEEERFSLWNPEATALDALVEYVEAVTDPDSLDFIPEADRIATFDMDGTLMAELAPTYLEVMLLTERILRDPSYQPDAEMLEFGRMTRDHALDKSFPDDYDYEFSYHQARAFAGMTLTEYADFITRFLVHEADGFEGMTYADAYYLPMVEVVDYLQDNGFKCYVVSGSDRFIVRTFVEGVFDIPAERCIGSDTALEARDQGDTDGIEYVFTGDDELVRTDRLIIKDLKTNKVLQIAQEIGRQPVLSFGNSSGDVSMNNYALLNNRYRSAAFMVMADDDVRDYGSSDKHDELTEKWQGMGYNVISMRDDWKTIYGEDVKKTGEFHWLADYADKNTSAYAYDEFPLERAGTTLHLDRVQMEGAEPDRDILLIHGVTYSSHEFDVNYEDYSLVRALAREGYAVWRLDIAGFGRSGEVEDGFLPDSDYAAEDINAAVEKICEVTGRDRIDVLGWSWGTVTVSLCAAKYPEHIGRLVLYAPILSGIGAYEVTEPFHHNTWEHAADDFRRTAAGDFDETVADPVVIEMLCSSSWHYDGETSPNGGRRDICVDESQSLIDLTKITVPTLVICGDSDPYLNYDRVNAVLDDLPEGSALEVIEGASHVAYLEKPYHRDFQDRLLGFLSGAEARTK